MASALAIVIIALIVLIFIGAGIALAFGVFDSTSSSSPPDSSAPDTSSPDNSTYIPSTPTDTVVVPPADAVVPPATTPATSTPTTVTPTAPAMPPVYTPTCDDPSAYYYFYAPDVKAANMDAFQHWNSNGWMEGRKSCWPKPVSSLATNGKNTMKPGENLVSTNGLYRLMLQADGNLVGYEIASGKSFWNSKSANKGAAPYQLVLQGDGNLVIYDSKGKAVWNAGTNSTVAPFLFVMQDDRNVVIYDSKSKALWNAGSSKK